MMEQDHEDFDNEQPLLEGYAQDMDSVQTTQARLPGDGAVTMAEKLAKHVGDNDMPLEELPAKRIKLDSDIPPTLMERQRGVAPIKSEYLVYPSGTADSRGSRAVVDDDAAEQGGHQDSQASSKRKIKNKGQNKNRSFGISTDAIELCGSRATQPEFSPEDCRFGEKCKFEHDLRRYLKEGKRSDLTTLGGVCPVWNTQGKCDTGWKCRFVGSHMEERECDDGRKELVLIEDEKRQAEAKQLRGGSDSEIVNLVGTEKKMLLTRKKISTPKSDKFLEWLERSVQDLGKDAPGEDRQNTEDHNHTEVVEEPNGEADVNRADSRASYIEPPLLPSEKRRVYFGADTPILAPLTTQGNLPFRRLCVELGAQVTYSEMAMGLPILQGQKSEWALMKAHVSEISPPSMKMPDRVVADYDNSRDMKFGAQIASNKVWQAVRTTEVLTSLCPHLRVVDLNCGCPIDLVYRTGGGSGLLDSPAKLEKMLRGMNTVSGEVPITAKIRTGTKDGKPTAQRLVERLILGGEESHAMGSGPSGVAAITLHGRTRQQRYTKSADWSYIADCAALIKSLQEKADSTADTIKEPDARLQSASGRADRGHVYFIGNGDCYSHVDYLSHLNEAHVDSVMVGRGALVKPWLFEEISTGQYIDKSATERLEYVERFVRYGLQTWGSDEMGIGLTRRFLLEWLNFTHRYVPIGLLEHLPPNLQDRAPTFRGRNELETLLASDNYKDWIKISEMFLGPATEGFKFVPKHKSKSYEIEAEG